MRPVPGVPGRAGNRPCARHENAAATFLSGNTDYSIIDMAVHIALTSSIAYAERSRHRLDICRPSDAIDAPVIIFFYGGAWRSAEAFIADTLRSAELGSRWPHNSHNIAVI